MIYDVTDNPLLSPAAQKLGIDELEAHASVAESLLGLSATAYTDEKYDKAAQAVALQISYQIATPQEAHVLMSSGRGSRSASYRGTAKKGMPVLHAFAKKLADSLKVKATSTAR